MAKKSKERLIEELEYAQKRQTRLVARIATIEEEQKEFDLQFLKIFKDSLRRVTKQIEDTEKAIERYNKPKKTKASATAKKKFSFSIKL